MSDAEIEDILKKGDIDKDGYWSHNYALHPINSFMNTLIMYFLKVYRNITSHWLHYDLKMVIEHMAE